MSSGALNQNVLSAAELVNAPGSGFAEHARRQLDAIAAGWGGLDPELRTDALIAAIGHTLAELSAWTAIVLEASLGDTHNLRAAAWISECLGSLAHAYGALNQAHLHAVADNDWGQG